jgi:2-polyprenyl-6-methoxyphenol hydroxylase-like FAD-dependent oxidoreductase
VLQKMAALGLTLPARYYTPVPASPVPSGAAPAAPTRPTRIERELAGRSVATIQINELQQLLLDHAKRMGIDVRFGYTFDSVEPADASGHVTVRLKGHTPEDTLTIRTQSLHGADGTRSAVRGKVGIGVRPGETQGQMVAAWFAGNREGQRDISATRDRGESGIVLGSGKTLYGLYALPKSMAPLGRKAPSELTSRERARLYTHVEAVTQKLLPADEAQGLRVTRHVAFPVTLDRAETAVAERYNTLILGDANQSINPYGGRGANLAMLQGAAAGEAAARVALHPERRAQTLRAYAAYAASGADHAQQFSRNYARSFGARPTAGIRSAARVIGIREGIAPGIHRPVVRPPLHPVP